MHTVPFISSECSLLFCIRPGNKGSKNGKPAKISWISQLPIDLPGVGPDEESAGLPFSNADNASLPVNARRLSRQVHVDVLISTSK